MLATGSPLTHPADTSQHYSSFGAAFLSTGNLKVVYLLWFVFWPFSCLVVSSVGYLVLGKNKVKKHKLEMLSPYKFVRASMLATGSQFTHTADT